VFFDEVIHRITWPIESVPCWACFVADHLEERSIDDGRRVHWTAPEVRHLAWCFMGCTASRADGFGHGWQLMVIVAVVAEVKLTGKVVSAGSVPSQQSLSHDRQDSGSAFDGLH